MDFNPVFLIRDWSFYGSMVVLAIVVLTERWDLKRQPRLVERRTVQIQKRRLASRNPVKSLILRTDLQDEYEEINTGVAEREVRRIKLEQVKPLIGFFTRH